MGRTKVKAARVDLSVIPVSTQKVTKPKVAVPKRKATPRKSAPKSVPSGTANPKSTATKNVRGSFANVKKTPTKRLSVRVRQNVDRFQPSSYSTPLKKVTLGIAKLPSATKKSTIPKKAAKRVSSTAKAQKSEVKDDEEEEENEIEDETTPKVTKKRARSTSKKSTPKPAKDVESTSKKAKKRSTTTTDDDEEKSAKKKKPKKGALTPRPNIKVYTVDPTFMSKETIPFVSTNNYSKLAIRAALMNDVNLLKRLIDDKQHVSSVHVWRSVEIPLDPCDYAMLNGDGKMLKMLTDDIKKPKPNRVKPVQSLLEKQGTGQYNFHMLGHAVRSIEMSRGGREGNNAFTRDSADPVGACCTAGSLSRAIKGGVDYRILQQLIVDGVVNGFEVSQNVFHAVRYGHRALAGAIIKDYGDTKFNDLHQHVLLNDKTPLRKDFKAVSAKKKGQFNKDITPIHCAAINPNVQYLKDLLAIEPDFSHPDQEGHRAIHYAAICESSGPLEFLLQKGASPYDMTNKVVGVTPLHRACETGRTKNVTVLLEFIKKNDPNLAILKLKSKTGMAPIHFAAMEGHIDVVKVLRKYGADVDVQTTASRKNVTPLMLAAQRGYYDMVEHLHTGEEAQLDKRDGLKRTALMHASINGAAHIVSYLLRAGVNTDLADSSGNTATHYAAAYGWYFCLKLLIEAGADVNVHNAWQLTPLSVAYMKGHMGLVDLLLQQSGTNINCKDDKGLTLVALTISCGVDDSTADQLNYLINEKHADPTLVDTYGNNPLHLLAVVNVAHDRAEHETDEEYERKRTNIIVDVAKHLMNSGCDPNAPNNQKETAFVLSVKSTKLDLALHFLKNDAISLNEQTKLEAGIENVLHYLVKNGGHPLSPLIFDELTKLCSEDVKCLLNAVDKEGLTPFLRVCLTYQTLALPEQQASCRNLIEKLLICCPKILEHKKIKPFTDEEVEAEENEPEEEEENDDDDDGDNQVHENGDGDESNLDGQGGKGEGKSKKRGGSTNETAFHLIMTGPTPQSSDNDMNSGRRPFGFNRGIKIPVVRGAGRINQAEPPKPIAFDSIPHARHSLLELLLQYYQSSAAAESKILETKDDLGRTPLYRSICEKDADSAILFINAGASVNFIFVRPTSDEEHKSKKHEKERPDKITVLMAAVINKLRDVVVAVLNEKASVHAIDTMQNTALHYACVDSSSTMSEIVTILLEAGANVEARNVRLRSPLHLICNADSGETDVSTETLEYLLLRNADPFVKDSRGRLPIHYAFVKIGDHKNVKPIDPVAVVTVLLRHMQAKPDMLNAADNWRQSPLHCAARRGANICCISLLRHAEVVLNPKDVDGNTPLGLAVYYNHKSCALTLLQANADVLAPILIHDDAYLNIDDYSIKTAWKWAPVKPPFVKAKTLSIPSSAIKNEWQGVVYVIMEMLGKQKDSSLKSLVEAGLEHRKYNFVLTLLRSAKNDARFILKASNWSGLLNEKNLIHLLADTADNLIEPQLQLKVVELLINLGIDLDDHKPVEGPFHPAFYAAQRHNFTLLKYFEENSKYTFDHWMPTSDGHTVFTMILNATEKWPRYALAWRMEWLEKFITTHRLSLNLLTKYPVPCDLTNSRIGLDRETDRMEQSTPLIRAVHAHDFDMAKLLLKLGADVNFADLDGRTPLMHAVRVNDEYLVKLFLNHSYEIPRKVANKSKDDNEENEDEDEEDEDEDEESDDEDDNGSDATYNDDESEDGPKRKKLKTAKNVRAFTGRGPKIIRSMQSGEGPSLKKALSKQKSTTCDDELVFKKTSQIDFSKKDNFGRTVIHHLVQPLPFGSWENVEFLKMFAKNGAPISTPDSQAKLPYEIACNTGQKIMAAEFEKYLKLPLSSSKVHFDSFDVGDDGTSSLNNVVVNLSADASRYIEERKKAKQKDIRDAEEREKRKKWRPHKLSDYADTGEICADESEPGVKPPRPYAVLLTKVDWNGPYGFYNFYNLQLFKRKGSNLYVVFTNWGRIGSPGQFQKTPFGSLADGLKEFKSIFRSKTGNDWTDLMNGTFKEQPKKYRPIDYGTGDDDKDEPRYRTVDVDINLETNLKSKLPDNLQKLFKDLTNVATLMHAAHSPFAGYQRNFPLIVTSLKRESILKAKNLLTEIGTKINELETLREQIGKITNSSHIVSSAIKVFEEIATMSLEFYHLLPMKGYEQSDLTIIENIDVLRDFNGMVDGLLDYERANETLCAAAYQRNVVHPYDYVYKALNCKLQLMTPSDDETQYILHYIYNTSPSADVKAIYKVFNENQASNFNPNKLDNHKLLWHGTGTANLISILSLGLLAAPPQAVQTGNLFGKGIYTADTFVKSQGYCRAGQSGVSYALLCEVALGQIREVNNFCRFEDKDPLKNGRNSLLGVGNEFPDPNLDVTLPTGVTMPLGELIKQKLKKGQHYFQLNYNEFVFYDPRQVIVRYLVAFKSAD